jgi:hypothetical protein
MEKHIIYETKKAIGIIPVDKYNEFVYENELKPIRTLLCECSPQFIDWINRCSKEDLVECLLSELKQDKCVLYSN